MENNLFSNILYVCKILNSHSVEYLIVGGAAVAMHGYYRASREPSGQAAEKNDIDIWYNPSYNNYFNLLNALEDLGEDVSGFRAETAPNPKKSFFRLDYEHFSLDFLPELPGLGKFRQSFNDREMLRIEDLDIFYINYKDLITNKRILGRPKDIEDIEQLKLRHPGSQ